MTDELGKMNEATITSDWEQEEKFEMLKDWTKKRQWVGRRDERPEGEGLINTTDDHAEAVEEKEWKMTEPSDFSFWMCGDATK